MPLCPGFLPTCSDASKPMSKDSSCSSSTSTYEPSPFLSLNLSTCLDMDLIALLGSFLLQDCMMTLLIQLSNSAFLHALLSDLFDPNESNNSNEEIQETCYTIIENMTVTVFVLECLPELKYSLKTLD